MAFGNFARLDDYNPDADFGLTPDEITRRIAARDPRDPQTTRERILDFERSPIGQGLGLRKAPADFWRKYDAAGAEDDLTPDPGMNLFAASPQQAPRVAAEQSGLPREAVDALRWHGPGDAAIGLAAGSTVARMVPHPLARAAVIAAPILGALTDQAEAAPKRVRAATGYDPTGWAGPVSDIAAAGAIPRGTHANWYMRHDPKGNVTLSNKSGPTGNTYAVDLKGGMTPDEMAQAVTGAPRTLSGKTFDMDELRRQNAHLVFGPTDKAAGGDWLQLPGASVRQEAGINFPFIHANTRIPGMPEDVAPLYASVSKGAASGVNNAALEILGRGGTPYYLPTIMGPGAMDSTNQMAFSTLAALRHANPNSAAIDALDAAVRSKKGAEGYPGFASPRLDDWLSSAGLNARRAFTEGASARSASDLTGVDTSLLRYANTDPRLRHTPSGSAGIVMGTMRPDVGITDYPLHSNYPWTFMGQRGEIGGLQGNMPFSQIAPDVHRALLSGKSPGGGSFSDTPAIQTMRGGTKVQPVTKEVVTNWRRWFDENPAGWAIPGTIGLGVLSDQSNYRQP